MLSFGINFEWRVYGGPEEVDFQGFGRRSAVNFHGRIHNAVRVRDGCCNSRSDENFISKKKILKLKQFLLKLKISK